jgi:hypothetical protein
VSHAEWCASLSRGTCPVNGDFDRGDLPCDCTPAAQADAAKDAAYAQRLARVEADAARYERDREDDPLGAYLRLKEPWRYEPEPMDMSGPTRHKGQDR